MLRAILTASHSRLLRSHGNSWHTCGLCCSFGCRRWWTIRCKDDSEPFPLPFRLFFWHCCQSPWGILNSHTHRGFCAHFIMQPTYTSSTTHSVMCTADKLFSFKRGWAPISGISEHLASRSLLACVVAVPLPMSNTFSLPLSLPHFSFLHMMKYLTTIQRDKKSRLDYQRSH